MNISNKVIKKLTILPFFIFILIGTLIYEDYGLTIDCENYRLNGVYYYNFIKEYVLSLINFDLTQISALGEEIKTSNIIERDHPAIFETILAFWSNVFHITESKNIYNFSHLINYLFYIINLYLLHKVFLYRFNSYLISIVSIFIIFLSPRFFSESFFNSRDIFFFSLFILNLYGIKKILKKSNIKNNIFLGFTFALLINAKILGIIPFIIFLVMYGIFIIEKEESKIANIKKLFLLIGSTSIFIILLWPYLWLNPIENFIKAFTNIITLHNQVSVPTLFFGEHMSSSDTPWYYRVVFFYLTTPLLVCLVFTYGFIILFKKIISNLIRLNDKDTILWKNNYDFIDSFVLITFIVVVFLTAKYNSSQFGGWRHLYFLYVPVIYIALIGYKKILSLNNILFINITKIIIIISIFFNSFWIINNHPFQYVYFNIIGNKYFNGMFDLDYAGVANLQSIKYILQNDKREKINISTISLANLNVSKLKLDKYDKKRVNIVDINNAHYLINSYMPNVRGISKVPIGQYEKFYEIEVDNYPINTVFKKK